MAQLKRAVVATGEWECMECGYIEEGVLGRRPLKCPECNAPASALEFFSYEDDTDWDQDEDEEEEFEDEQDGEYDQDDDESFDESEEEFSDDDDN
jgi:predicted ATP-dependent serine protease